VIDLMFVTSPNVTKISIALEEMGLQYRLCATDLSRGDHLRPEKLGGAITGKLPVIVDHAPRDGGTSLTVFESGAILLYLAEKCGRFLPLAGRHRLDVIQWLFWQVGGIGPIGGQVWHFRMFAPRIAPEFDNSYAENRYNHMFSALWRVMDARLAGSTFLGGDYSIADMACFPWIAYVEPPEGISAFPNVLAWRDRIAGRPAVRAAYARGMEVDTGYARAENGASLFPWEGLVEHVIVV
jgi:GST-like protein